MKNKSKLREKPVRFSAPVAAIRNERFEQYKIQIVQQNKEAARAAAFFQLLHEWFSKSIPSLLDDYLKGIEKTVKVTEGSYVMRGEIDALFGNLIIEFESDLTSKSKLREAKEQLKSYAYALITTAKESRIGYLCLASDGVHFYVYAPHWNDPRYPPTSPDEIDLREIDRVDFSKFSGDNAFLWIDRYFFRTTQLHPTTEEFVRDFGINSPAYAFALRLLREEWFRVHNKNEFKVIYENWDRYLLIAYGTTVADSELFLRHTYLATFAKLLAFMRLAKKVVAPTPSEVADIFTGQFFVRLGIDNFLEEDFFAWIAREKVRQTLIEMTRRLSSLLEKYHLQEISEDVLKSLYQELVDPETRHDLGEFYTPDWLADRIVRHALKNKPEASVLDPSCGSGSFLYFAIRYKRQRLGDSKEILQHIRDTVVGIDIHPLAVIISKTNYLLGLGELVRRRVKDFHIPVYMANSLKIPERSSQMSTDEKVPSMYVELDHTFVPFPEVFIQHPASFDEAVDTCYDFANGQGKQVLTEEQFRRFAKRRITEAVVDDSTLDVLYGVAKRMHYLKEKERNSIWAFILKNVYKPIFLRKQFEWILGNPPWLSYRYVEKGEYQEFLRNAILKKFGLLKGNNAHLITHLELGTLFFVASLNEYGKHGASIGFVLPRSVFTSDQHNNFRKSNFGNAIHQTGLKEVWDLDGVSNLFNVPSCVVFGKHFHHTTRPLPAKVISGQFPSKERNSSFEESSNCLTTRESQLHVIQQGERSFWSEDQDAEVAGNSPYASKFFQGATIVPRTAWFVEIKAERDLGLNPTSPYVKTDRRATEQAKEAYEDLIVEGNIERDFLYATLLSTDLLPFGFLNYRPVVLPIKPSKEQFSDTFVMVTAEMAHKEGYVQLASWLDYCEKEWNRRRKKKASKMNIYERLDHVRGLTQQHYKSKYKIVYPTSATNLCSAVVPNEKITLKFKEQEIILQNFVAESKLYYYETADKLEAHYLSAFLNAPVIDEMIKPMQSRGLWGPRDIHKKVWELPIPAFIENKSSHSDLAQLSIFCTKKVQGMLPKLDTRDITPGKIGRLRSEVREKLAPELQEINDIVRKILGK